MANKKTITAHGRGSKKCGNRDKTCGTEIIRPHKCPYLDEIYEDKLTLCRCCKKCASDCHDET